MTWIAGAARDHPRHLIALALAMGLALHAIGPVVIFMLAWLLVLASLAVRARADVALAVCAVLLAGYGVGAVRIASIDADPLSAAPKGALTLRGYLVQLPRETITGTTMRIRIEGARQLVELRSAVPLARPSRIGDEVAAHGRLQPVSPRAARTPESRSYAEFLLRNGVRRKMTVRTVVLTGRRRGGAAGAVDSIRSRAESALAIGLAPEPAALLRGMVLGGDAGLPESTVEDFRVAGLSHILAVSGQNVMLIVILVQALLTAGGAGRRWRLSVPAGVILIYVALCGAQASVVRAGAMGLAGLAAIAASRPSSRIYALILAAIVVLVWNPRATADVGAQLSFAAVLGLMVFTRPLADRFGRLPDWCAEALGATLGATLATAPLMAFHFEAVSVISLLANVIGEPLVGPVVWLGSLTAAIGQFSPGIAGLLNAPNGFLLGTLIEIAHGSARVPGAQVASPGFGRAGLLIGGTIVCAFALALHGRLPKARLPGLPGRRLVVAIAILLLAWSFARPPANPVSRPAIVMLDVGQGDATLLLGDGCVALIDAGPPGDRLEEKLRGYGVSRLDALLLTHPETDHFGGAAEISEHVETLIDGGGNTDRADYNDLRGRLASAGARSLPAVAGTKWSCPGIVIEVIAPGPEPRNAPPPANPNTRAAVTLVEVGPLRMFASGDAESPQLLPLTLQSAEILKVPHHGSDDPGLTAVLKRVRPRLALIGVGAHNRYGHPAPSTIDALGASGAEIRRTDRDGDIVVTPAGVRTSGAGR